MGGDLPVGRAFGGPEPCVAEGAAADFSPGVRFVSLAFSTRRARPSSRARLSPCSRRSASVTAEPTGLGDAGGDGGGDVSLPARVKLALDVSRLR